MLYSLNPEYNSQYFSMDSSLLVWPRVFTMISLHCNFVSYQKNRMLGYHIVVIQGSECDKLQEAGN